MRDDLVQYPSGPHHGIGADRVGHFMHQAQGASGTVEEVDTLGQVSAAAAVYPDGLSAGHQATGWDAPAGRPWRGAGLDVVCWRPVNDDMVGITGFFCAMIQTGTLVLPFGGQSLASTASLPKTHVAIVPAARIIGWMEDAFARARRGARRVAAGGQFPLGSFAYRRYRAKHWSPHAWLMPDAVDHRAQRMSPFLASSSPSQSLSPIACKRSEHMARLPVFADSFSFHAAGRAFRSAADDPGSTTCRPLHGCFAARC